MTGIYAIHNKMTDKYYIGQAGDIEYRWMQHKSRLKCQNHENKHLQASYNLYGADSFEYFIIEECDKNDLDVKEKIYIKKYDSYRNGYNQDEGGAGCKGYKHTSEEIMKMRLIQSPKAVLQLDKELNIVAEWVSSAHASKTLGFYKMSIDKVCLRKDHQKSIGGYIWVYKDEYESGTVDWDYYLNVKEAQPKRVGQYDLSMNLIQIYDSISQCSKILNINTSEISMVCNYKRKTSHGFIFRFTDEASYNSSNIENNNLISQ